MDISVKISENFEGNECSSKHSELKTGASFVSKARKIPSISGASGFPPYRSKDDILPFYLNDPDAQDSDRSESPISANELDDDDPSVYEIIELPKVQPTPYSTVTRSTKKEFGLVPAFLNDPKSLYRMNGEDIDKTLAKLTSSGRIPRMNSFKSIKVLERMQKVIENSNNKYSKESINGQKCSQANVKEVQSKTMNSTKSSMLSKPTLNSFRQKTLHMDNMLQSMKRDNRYWNMALNKSTEDIRTASKYLKRLQNLFDNTGEMNEKDEENL